MRELDCDFCGAAAAGAYEVLPPELDPSSDEQVRVVLCPDCRTTLDGVLAPLLDRLGADGAGATDGGSGTRAPPASTGSTAARDPDPDTESDAQANARSGDPSLPADDAIIIGDDEGAGDGDGTDSTGDDAAEGEPDHFRQVMRLLGNREFPVDRAEVVDLADSAYDLDAGEADAIVDYAVENDVLEEEDGGLYKT